MLKIEVDKIDSLHSVVRKLKVLTFLQSFVTSDLVEDDDYYLENLNLSCESVKRYLSELLYDAVVELCDIVYSEGFIQK